MLSIGILSIFGMTVRLSDVNEGFYNPKGACHEIHLPGLR